VARLRRIFDECGSAPGDIAYVADRMDNDIWSRPRRRMVTVCVMRGRWMVTVEPPNAALFEAALLKLISDDGPTVDPDAAGLKLLFA
jgi:hypothetical protein